MAHNRLLIDESPLQFQRSLATAIGLNDAIFLQQLHWWLGISKNEHDGRRWVYNTFEEWQEQFPFWSLDTLQRIAKRLVEKELLYVHQFGKSDWDRKNWYAINYDKLGEYSAAFDNRNLRLSTPASCGSLEDRKLRLSSKDQEITQENTTVYIPPSALPPEERPDPQQGDVPVSLNDSGSGNPSAGAKFRIPPGYSPPHSDLVRMTANLNFDKGETDERVKQWRHSRTIITPRWFTSEPQMLADLSGYLSKCATGKRR